MHTAFQSIIHAMQCLPVVAHNIHDPLPHGCLVTLPRLLFIQGLDFWLYGKVRRPKPCGTCTNT